MFERNLQIIAGYVNLNNLYYIVKIVYFIYVISIKYLSAYNNFY